MADQDLLFSESPLSQPATLLFGEVESPPDIDATLDATLPGLTVDGFLADLFEATLAADMPGLSVAIWIAHIEEVSIDATLPGLSVAATALYRSETSRPTVGRFATDFQVADRAHSSANPQHQIGAAISSLGVPVWGQALKLPAGFTLLQPTTFVRSRDSIDARFANADRLRTSVDAAYRAMLRTVRPLLNSSFQTADPLRASLLTDWQERYRDRRPSLLSAWDEARPIGRLIDQLYGTATKRQRCWYSPYQEAVVPPPGMYVIPGPAAPTPCYVPPFGDAVHLLFQDEPGGTGLVFICETHTLPPATSVVPIRRVYIVLNTATLVRVSDSVEIPVLAMSLSIDVDSWTWTFSATLPGAALNAVMPDLDGTPVELQATINGNSYRVLAEKLVRSRSFNQATINLSGRGKSAVLAAPMSAIFSFANATDRTAQQLMEDALTVNGVPIGWTLDWQIDDWLVPAGSWGMQGAHIDALAAIAAAGGAYLQPHPTNAVMRVLARYPALPWEWDGVTPDFEVPSSVTTVEGIEWLERRFTTGCLSAASKTACLAKSPATAPTAGWWRR